MKRSLTDRDARKLSREPSDQCGGSRVPYARDFPGADDGLASGADIQELGAVYRQWKPEDPEMEKLLREYTGKDKRIRVKNLSENLGIAGNTNAALEMAEGEFIGLLDHDDLLAPNALYEVAAALAKDSSLDAVYTDEDKVTTDLGEHFQPHLKPDFNLDLLRSNNYICHFFVVRRSVFEKTGGFRSEFEGAQDYDFISPLRGKCGEGGPHSRDPLSLEDT